MCCGEQGNCYYTNKKHLTKPANFFFSAHTVLQGSQQGNDTSIQHVPIVVETHHVTVEHPAELQPESAESEPMTKQSNSTSVCAIYGFTFPLSMHKSSVCITSELQHPHKKLRLVKTVAGIDKIISTHLMVL